MSDEITSGYTLTRQWFDFAFENPDLVSTNETALYCWLVELNNRLGWVNKFGITSKECMNACGFNTYPPYRKSLKNLIDLGFVKLVKKSANQFQCNIISLPKINKNALSKNNKALDSAISKIDKAIVKASLKQPSKHLSYSLNTETPKHRTKEGESTTTIPTLEEVKKYFTENGYTDQIALKAFEYYSSTGWKDKNGKPVQNWKSKMVNVWFKEEHKSKQDLRMLLPKEQRGLNF